MNYFLFPSDQSGFVTGDCELILEQKDAQSCYSLMKQPTQVELPVGLGDEVIQYVCGPERMSVKAAA